MDDLIESILDYVRSDYTDYAIMINGEWGSGKTYFWNNQVKKKIESLKLNGNLKKCIVKEMQQDPFGKIIHIDFQSINKGDVVKLKIPVNFVFRINSVILSINAESRKGKKYI